MLNLGLILTSLLISSQALAANPSIKASLNKREIKSSESFSVSYSLLSSTKRRISAPAGTSVVLKRYPGVNCSGSGSIVGSTSLSESSTLGSYSLSSPGTYYLKPELSGYEASCMGPLVVLNNSVQFQNLSLSKTSHNLSKASLSLRWEDNSGILSPSSSEKASLSLYSNSACSVKLARSRVFSLSPKNGLASLTVKRVASGSYAKAVSGSKSSSCIEIPALGNEPCTTANIPNSSAVSGNRPTCSVVSCATGFHIESNSCVSDTKACTTLLGSGTQTWNGSFYGSCSITSCNDISLYSLSGGACNPIDCTVLNSGISNAASVSGNLVSGCTLQECSEGFKKRDGACSANQAPVSENQNVSLNEDGSLIIQLSATDADGDSLSYSVNQPDHGTLSGSGTSWTYTPAANYNGADAFTFKANDGSLDSNVYTVSITVNPVNDAPVAVDDNLSGNIQATAGSQISISVSSLLSNDFDLDNTSPLSSNSGLTVSSVAGASTGTVSLSGNTVLFTPSISFNGNATFSYTISDGILSSSATVTIPVGCSDGYLNNSGVCSPALPLPTISSSYFDSTGNSSSRRSQSCSITPSGGVKCWGNNFYGQLGDGTTTNRSTPVNVSGLTSGVVSVSTGSNHTCAVMNTGSVKCWGYNSSRQLGDFTTTTRLTPVQVFGLTSGVVSVSLGEHHTCALMNTGSVKCWGTGSGGAIGDGTTTQRETPVNVLSNGAGSAPLTGVVSVSAGDHHTCALMNTGSVKCWGQNSNGQLGDGTTIHRSTPVQVSGLTSGVVSVSAAGRYHTCALMNTGAVKCWGENFFGNLGDGTTTDRSTPVQVSGLTSGVVSVSAGYNHNCVITSAGAAQCWGQNSNRQLGDGTTTNRSTPVQVSGLTSGAVSVSLGEAHTCALMNTGSVKCWGFNFQGQLGDGTTTTRLTSVDVLGLTASTKPTAMKVIGSCYGNKVKHRPSAYSQTNREFDCINNLYFISLDSSFLDDIFTEILSPNRVIRVYDSYNDGRTSSDSTNSSIEWP